jgi:hypothetical protein
VCSRRSEKLLQCQSNFATSWALTAFRIFAGTQASPRTLQLKQAFKHSKRYARRNDPFLNTNKFASTLTHENLYAIILNHASTYVVGLERKVASLLSYSDACEYNHDLTHVHLHRRLYGNKYSQKHYYKHARFEARALAWTNASSHTSLNGDERLIARVAYTHLRMCGVKSPLWVRSTVHVSMRQSKFMWRERDCVQMCDRYCKRNIWPFACKLFLNYTVMFTWFNRAYMQECVHAMRAIRLKSPSSVFGC